MAASGVVTSDAPSAKSTRKSKQSSFASAGTAVTGCSSPGRNLQRLSRAGGNDVSTLPDFPAEIRAPVEH